ncbi:DUF4954 family protein [Brachyspira hyodysenteriae]|uniref:DUF4954 domain-containing protein n=1 Tax=Brachyspira hyodysenteriae ATCC 27164 TaxID=1266923 RepID=A0A3B6VZR1_BRAHO|nr:DUF4954 family protein [Brachyspira hyodysenteriae]ANN64318.1 DUF4954 domain-containing protein [Brachyspira hyodysenteriae ATCC 27164]KLI20007.1 hypothetical protein SU43_13085 [Brachyspira hyodysenteriae]KLI21602.1 hypothetical protein SU46_01905 [Brachyspira hyodysenteriae]KLI26814.1 hypothetical protein SZ47_05145 [Brachyspira hyodysenteriae]KLI32573.1 hypothetical protein SZ49_01770 [Brachyspira hyodysenteriae]
MYIFKKQDKDFRNLTSEEINFLKSQGCSSQSWEKILIKNVDLSRIKDVQFHGKIKINSLNGMVKYHKKVKLLASINRATLINVYINGNVYINNVGRFIENYKIENGVIIENAGSIYMEGKSSFGNGVETSPIMEGNGRSVKIFYRLNSHIAYLVSMYRHEKIMREKINSMIDEYTKQKTRRFGKIKKYAKIINARLIKNSLIDPYATIENTDEINNTTVISTKECPSYIGTSVILTDSIVLKGAHIVDGTVIKKAFIGEGVKLGRQFSCEDSLLFANCEGEHGEMFSIFAGPYTVTHHKATLLIASHFSFFNAGSGTNQSNHMYKLGPYHHGFMERGCKTGSNSYILWPSHIGAFSTVIGAHYDNVDTSDFPFSYITEHGYHQTRLIPALNLFGVGLSRDENKWRERDRRKGDKKDLIIFNVFSPYTVSKMINSEKILEEIKNERNNNNGDFLTYKNMIIKISSLDKYSKRYSIAIDLYLHNKILSYIENSKNIDEIIKNLNYDENSIFEKWVDIGGLICAKQRIDNIIKDLENDKISDVKSLTERFEDIYNLYSEDEKSWVMNTIKSRYNIKDIDKETIKKLLNNHKSLLEEAYNIFYKDVEKEYDASKMVSSGIDDKSVMEKDFEAVRGTVNDNTFVIKYKKDMENKIESINNIINIL